LKSIHQESASDDGILRISTDAKAVVKVGAFSRNGKSRTTVKAQDHDFHPDATVTPIGLFLPEHDELSIAMVMSKVTSDCIVDYLDAWWGTAKARFPEVHTLLLNQDNGPENSSRRTQFLKRIIEFVDTHKINVRLAYYPPYHSKYNPIERCWGVLENYWNGALLDTVDAVVGYAGAMRWKGNHPVVELVTKNYNTGVRVSKNIMMELELRLQREEGLEKWFVDIPWIPDASVLPV